MDNNNQENKVSLDHFEGPEKLLEVWFECSNKNLSPSLRKISDEDWQLMLNDVKCVILNKISNNHFDAFLLSESSLFVFKDKIILKTCGTTTLLKAIPKLIEFSKRIGFDNFNDFFYSRKNFDLPENQQFPHYNFNTEVSYLDKVMHEHSLSGGAYILGRVNQDHWNLYISDQVKGPAHPDQTLEILMNKLDPEKMKYFYCPEKEKCKTLAIEAREKSGIIDFLPGSLVDDVMFHPCGYSANGLLEESYWTIHITPQPEFSYVSFETNYIFEDYTSIIEKVLNAFNPKDFIITLFANNHAKARSLPENKEFLSKYKKVDGVNYNFESYDLTLVHYKL